MKMRACEVRGRRLSPTGAAIGCLAVFGAAVADPGRPPGPATVALVHAETFLTPRSLWTPASVYPLGKLDFRVVAPMLDRAVMLATGTSRIEEAWRTVVKPGERVGILLDAQDPPATLGLVDLLIDRLLRIGVRAGDITIWGQDERVLFSAGLQIHKDPQGISTMGADSEGYRGSVCRIVVDYCDTLINVARLRVHPRLGLWGALANALACVPPDERLRLMSAPSELPSVLAKPLVRRKFVLHLLDALQPNYEVGPVDTPPYWQCGTLLAATDAVALDCVGLQVLEAKRQQVKGAPWPLDPTPTYLRSASEVYRVGQADPTQIAIARSEVGAQ